MERTVGAHELVAAIQGYVKRSDRLDRTILVASHEPVTSNWLMECLWRWSVAQEGK